MFFNCIATLIQNLNAKMSPIFCIEVNTKVEIFTVLKTIFFINYSFVFVFEREIFDVAVKMATH